MVADVLSGECELSVNATVRTKALAAACSERLPEIGWRLFDAETLESEKLAKAIEGNDWVVNAIGIIKAFIHDDKAVEVERAVRVNALFPHLLARAAEETGARVIQIATDCVYSGQKGRYIESDKHDALDVYGKTKSLGEVTSSRVTHLRCSVIGPETKSHVSLLDWFLGQQKGAKLNGFTNHQWNGVTTLHFAKICRGIITRNVRLPQLQHIVPKGAISKCDMLRCFAENCQRGDLTINPSEAGVVIDRTLATVSAEPNLKLWGAAGYPQPPTVPEMIAELARHDFCFGAR